MTAPSAEIASAGRVPWELATAIQRMRGELYERAEHTAELYELIRREGLDRRTIEAHAGLLVACPVKFLPDRTFEMVDHGTSAAVIEAFDSDDCTVVDLVAWPFNKPDRFATALGHAGGLGLARVRNPASFYGGRPLRVYRTPLAWLKAGCGGVVVLREESAFLWLSAALGDLAAEDLEHARMLHRVLHPFFDPSRILVPKKRAA
ncbi:MAG TPA: hypothetical protein VGU24_04955 [Microvirga sp.]|jgi:hypothetical protein|nr:hypothetical protein [Microvirga sp.]